MNFIALLSLLYLLHFGQPQPPCGDGNLYAWEQQTAGDDRFSAFPKISSKRNGPEYPSGDKQLDRYIRQRLVLDDEAKQHTFMLNYYFTVKCDGTIADVEVLGDPIVKDWTNIASVVQHTSGWIPAEKNGKPVDCIYFRMLQVNGSDFR